MADLEGWIFPQDEMEGACFVATRQADKGKKVITIVYAPCFHKEVVDAVPNPRKKWPDSRTCPGCGKKRRVCEIEVKRNTPQLGLV